MEAYEREPFPNREDGLVVLAVRREPVVDEADCRGGHGGTRPTKLI